MAAIEDAIRSRCTTQLTATVASRVYPVVLPSVPTYPAIVYHLLSEERRSAMGQNLEVVRAHVQFNALAKDASTAKTVARQVKDAWDRIGAQTIAGVTIQDSFPETVYDLPLDPAEPGVFGAGVDVFLEYNE